MGCRRVLGKDDRDALIEDALQTADRSKNEFLAILAHELRNPLAPIRNAVQILNREGALAPESQWALSAIDRQVRQMARLIDDRRAREDDVWSDRVRIPRR